MLKTIRKGLLIAAIMVLVFAMLPFQADAASSGEVAGLKIERTSGDGQDPDNSVVVDTVTSCAQLKIYARAKFLGGETPRTDTFTITNPSSDAVLLCFDYGGDPESPSVSKCTRSRDVDDVTRYRVVLAAKASFTIKFTATSYGYSNKVTRTFEMNNITVIPIQNNVSTTVTFDKNMGSVTYNSKAVTSGTPFTVTNTGKNLVATPKTGYSFVGWKDASGNVVSYDNPYQLYITDGHPTTLTAEFAEGATPYFRVQSTGNLYRGLNEAVAAANTTKDTIILVNSGTLASGTYTIPNYVTLLIPFDELDTCYVETPLPQYPGSPSTATPYRTLTMASGAEIIVEGTMSVSSRVNSGNTKAGYASAAPVGKYGHVAMEKGSKITVEANAKLSVYGYITGDGSVEVKDSATVYEGFQIADFRGGSVTYDMSGGILGNDKPTFPLSQYYVQNILTPLKLHAGATETCFVSLYMSSTFIDSTVAYIGASDSLFKMDSGYLVKDYDEATDRLVIDIHGNLSITSFSLDIKYLFEVSINSATYVLPITNSVTVNVNSGTVTVDANMSMQPGAEINIGKEGEVVLASGKSLYLYDLDQWKYIVTAEDNTTTTYYFCYPNAQLKALAFVPAFGFDRYTRTATDLKDAQITVGGVLDVSAGSFYSSKGSVVGGAVPGEEGGKVVISKKNDTTDWQYIQSNSIGHVEIPMGSAVLLNADGTTTGSDTDGEYYYYHGLWHTPKPTITTVSVVDPTCTEDGYTNFSCDTCNGLAYTGNVVPALGHAEITDTAVDPTCTETGLTEGKHCDRCNETLIAQTVVAKLPHTEVVDAAVAATCTETGLTEGKHCSVCNTVLVKQEVVDALGHDTVVDAKVDPTCTETGLTEGSHCGRCNVVLVAQEKIDALGHTDETIPTVPPTCTETGLTAGCKCSVCGAILIAQEEVAALGHTEVIDNAVAPTYSAAGKTEGKHCSVCSDVLVEQKIIDVASVDGTNFTILSEAFAAAAAGDNGTVTLLHDISGNVPVNQVVTIVTKGHVASIVPGDGYAYAKTEGVVTVWKLISISGTSLKAGDTLDIYFFVEKAALGDSTNYVARVTRNKLVMNPGTGKYENEETYATEIPYVKWSTYGTKYLRFCYSGIAAKEMSDEVHVTIYDTANKQISMEATESVRGYAKRTLDQNPEATELRTALVDMLNYGTAAQTNFGYRTNSLANDVLTDEQKAFATSGDISYSDITEKSFATGYGLPGATVTAENNLFFTFYFSGIADKNQMSATVTYTNHYGTLKKLEISGSEFVSLGSNWGVQVTGLAIADGRQPITCVLKDGGGQTVATVISSVESYLAATRDDSTKTAELKAVCLALMKFVDSAYAYFH